MRHPVGSLTQCTAPTTLTCVRMTTIRNTLLCFGLTMVALAWAGSAQAQGTGKVNGVTSTSTRTRGGESDPNVRRDEAANPVDKSPTPEPPGKSTRGAVKVDPGYICIDSRADLIIKIYVNGAFAGTVAPWGDSCGHYGPGDHRIYARAVFADGSYSSWGPLLVDATPGFRWTIKP